MDKERIAVGNSEINPNPLFLIGIPRGPKGRIRWATLVKKPDQLKLTIESEARRFIAEGHPFTEQALRAAGMGWLIRATQRFYPGQRAALRESLGMNSYGYSYPSEVATSESNLPKDKRGRVYWSKLAAEDPDRLPQLLETEVKNFIEAGGHFTQQNLKTARLSGLGAAIIKFYPGGSEAMREKVGAQLARQQRPQDYWTPEAISAEALEFYRQHGDFSYHLLRKENREDLVNVLRKYPGGTTQLRIDINLVTNRKPAGYWTIEHIEEESKAFYIEHGDFSQTLLRKLRMTSLVLLISTKYPGGWAALREKIGMSNSRKPKGYWNNETIEQESWQVYQGHGFLTQDLLTSLKRYDLLLAITKKYPGGLRVLRQKLGINAESVSISTEMANEQLRRLFENT